MQMSDYEDKFIKRSALAITLLIILFAVLIWKVDHLVSVMFNF